MSDDLEKRVEQFQCFELPGQPMSMHMGTSYLVNDLWKEIERLRAELDDLKAALMDAIDWNWLDDDKPECLYREYYKLAEAPKPEDV